MRYLFILCVFFFVSNVLTAQDGQFIGKNYNLQHEFFKLKTNKVVHDSSGKMYFATSKGVLSYNGVEWALVATSKPVLDIVISNKLVARTETEIGIIQQNKKGETIFVPIQLQNTSNPISVVSLEDSLYVLYKHQVDIYNLQSGKLQQVCYPKDTTMTIENISILKNQIYCFVKNYGLFKVHKGKIISTGISALSSANIACIYSTLYKNFFVTTSGVIYGFDGKSLTKKIDLAKTGLTNVEISAFAILTNGDYALATKNKGVLIISHKEGKIITAFDENVLIKENKIYDLCIDNSGDLWISHKSGISKVNTSFPIRDFSFYPGLIGELKTCFVFDNSLFVGTSEGIFKLNKVQEISRFNKSDEEKNKLFKSDSSEFIEIQSTVSFNFNRQSPDSALNKDFLFTGNFDLDKENNSNLKISEIGNYDNDITKYIHSTWPFYFQKINGISGSCIQFTSISDYLIIATDNGIYRLKNNKVDRISTIKGIVQIQVYDSVIYALSYSKLTTLNVFEKSKISQISLFTEANSLVVEENLIWIGGNGKLAYVSSDNKHNLSIPKFYKIPVDVPSEVFVFYLNEPLFLAGNEIFGFDALKDSVVTTGEIPAVCKTSLKIIAKQAGFAWTYSCSGWHNLGKINPKAGLQRYFSLFPDISDIYIDSDEQIWIVTKNRIFQLKSENEKLNSASYDVIISSFYDKKGKYYTSNEISLPMYANAIDFSVAALSFIDESQNMYRFKIVGLTENWSDWEKRNSFSVPYLPGGEYTLLVESKNAIGKIVAAQPLNIKVPENFFKAWWFYLIVGLVLIISILIIYFLHVRLIREEQMLLTERIRELESKNTSKK